MFEFLDCLGNKIRVGDQIQYYSSRIKSIKQGIVEQLVYKEIQRKWYVNGTCSNVSAYVMVYIPGDGIKEARWNVIRNFSLTSQVIK